MSRRTRQRWRWTPLLILLAFGTEPTVGQNPPGPAARPRKPPISLFDSRLETIRRASVTWDLRAGPARQVVDQVCLVPDLPTFFEAIAAWDDKQYFPILIDDVEYTFKFLRAFRPARIVRYPKPAAAIPADLLWDRARAAVAASWSGDSATMPAAPLMGDAVPKALGSTPPGVVLSAPDAPMLAGAVALAAGRFQPLVRFDSPKHFADVLTADEANTLIEALEARLEACVPNHTTLGDDCDFLTLAGDWPFRFEGKTPIMGNQPPFNEARVTRNNLDDLLGRVPSTHERWAFTGRLLGDPTQSVYRAMCSLFLQPESALLFNGYDEAGDPWVDYSMQAAAGRLTSVVPTTHLAGDRRAGPAGWHTALDPWNKFGLLLINSHGHPTIFNLRGGPAVTADIPISVPAAVLMIHSFSAADPTDPKTIAGRWLANGAFVFFGAADEPYLQSFRTPRLECELIAEKIPLGVVPRATLYEAFGQPWKLVYLGDPLYRVRSRSALEPRLARRPSTANWLAYEEFRRPPASSAADVQLAWVLKTALFRQQKEARPSQSDNLADVLLALKRDQLPTRLRPLYDALLADLLFFARRRGELRAGIAAVPRDERSSMLQRYFEATLTIDLNVIVARGDFTQARAFAAEVLRSDAPREIKEQTIARLAPLADSPVRLGDWRTLLRASLRDKTPSPDADVINAELKRVDEALKIPPQQPADGNR